MTDCSAYDYWANGPASSEPPSSAAPPKRPSTSLGLGNPRRRGRKPGKAPRRPQSSSSSRRTRPPPSSARGTWQRPFTPVPQTTGTSPSPWVASSPIRRRPMSSAPHQLRPPHNAVFGESPLPSPGLQAILAERLGSADDMVNSWGEYGGTVGGGGGGAGHAHRPRGISEHAGMALSTGPYRQLTARFTPDVVASLHHDDDGGAPPATVTWRRQHHDQSDAPRRRQHATLNPAKRETQALVMQEALEEWLAGHDAELEGFRSAELFAELQVRVRSSMCVVGAVVARWVWQVRCVQQQA